MFKKSLPFIVLIIFLLSACAPQIIRPEEVLLSGERELIFGEVLSIIGTQPFTSDTSGWIIQDSDQAGGFIRTTLSRTNCPLFSDCTVVTETISITLASKEANLVTLLIGRTNHPDAIELANRIKTTLQRRF